MTIERLLETDFKPAPMWGIRARIKLSVHCSCGKDYIIKEKFYERYSGMVREYIRPTKCPKCKEISYIKHIIQSGKDYAVYSPEIVVINKVKN